MILTEEFKKAAALRREVTGRNVFSPQEHDQLVRQGNEILNELAVGVQSGINLCALSQFVNYVAKDQLYELAESIDFVRNNVLNDPSLEVLQNPKALQEYKETHQEALTLIKHDVSKKSK